MATVGSYEEYTQTALGNFARKDAAKRDLLVDAVKDLQPQTILDLGCGAGQDVLPFVEKTAAFCIGLDFAAELGATTKAVFQKDELKNRTAFVRAAGETMPFADQSFDVVLCRVALPYMHNRKILAEVARVLKPNGVFLLKTHAPAFYFALLKDRAKTLNPKQIAYPLICLTGSLWHSLSGKQLTKGFWAGKEIFQTENFIKSECAKNNLRVERQLSDTSRETQSFMIVKKSV